MSRRSPVSLVFAAGALAILAAHCGIPQMPDDQASRCQSGLDLFEHGRCDGVTPTAEALPTVKQELAQYQQCGDRASAARMPKLRACVDRYQAAYDEKLGQHDEVRQKYAKQAAAVRADPAYKPLLDRWALARDEADIAQNDWEQKGKRQGSSPYFRVYEAKKTALDKLSAEMRDLLAKHGVDPKDATALGLF